MKFNAKLSTDEKRENALEKAAERRRRILAAPDMPKPEAVWRPATEEDRTCCSQAMIDRHNAHHTAGICCKPCQFFPVKNKGCKTGADCEFCHICRMPPRSAKRQRKRVLEEKRALLENPDTPLSGDFVPV